MTKPKGKKTSNKSKQAGKPTKQNHTHAHMHISNRGMSGLKTFKPVSEVGNSLLPQSPQ